MSGRRRRNLLRRLNGDYLPRWIVRQIEVDPTKFIPYAGHILADVVLTMDNSAMAIIQIHGTPFELAPMAERVARRDRINTLLRQLADPDRRIYFHQVRHLSAPEAPQPTAKSSFVRALMGGYNRVIFKEDRVFRNDWFISIVMRQPPPAISRMRKIRDWIPFTKRTRPPLGLTEAAKQSLNDACQSIQATLADYETKRLGLVEIPSEAEDFTVPITEIGTALHLIRTAHLVAIPHTTGSLAASIYTEPVVIKRRHFELNIAGLQRVGAMVSFQNYPARCRPGMFDAFLKTPYPCVVSHSFQYRSTGAALAAMKILQTQMSNAKDAADDLSEGIGKAANATASMRTASGLHLFGLAVYAPNWMDLDRAVADAIHKVSHFGGASPVRETNRWYSGALESAYYLQLPGCRAFKPRPGTISTLDLADMATLDNYPTGAASGYWGPSPIRFLTNGLTCYDFVPHDEDVGHFGIYGRIGSGKTALLGMLLACFEPIMGPDGIRVIIDKDESNKLLIEAAGGVATTLRRNMPSGLAPLVAYANTPRNQSFLHRLYVGLIERDGRGSISNDEDARMKRGIVRQLEMPPEQRCLGGIREFLGYHDRETGAGARFEKYCAAFGGSMAWLLDNREHVIGLGAGMYSFDFTDLIPKDGEIDDGSCHIAASVIMHQLSDLMDGRKIVAACDESRFYMEPLKRLIEDYSLTGRKKELILGLLAQQPEHHTDTAMGLSLVQQMRRKFIFPDASLDVATLRDKLKISPAAIRELKGDMTLGNARRFLLWGKAPVICGFDLTGLEFLPILAGRSKTVELMEAIKAERGDVPQAALTSEFIRRLAITEEVI